ncbi:S1C family serine protease [Bacteroidota bacterium]
MKKLISISIIVLLSMNIAFSQQVSDMLEDAISAVVTVGVFKTELAKTALGFRGEAATETAYQEALDLSGAQSSGSGFIIEKNGKRYIITNAHVVESASGDPESIYVFTINRSKYEVKVVGGDSFYDIAVLEFVDNPGSEISTMSFTKSEPRLGEEVFAIGNPLGEYPYSVSDGIISAKNRVRGSMTGKFGFLQTTATLIWGNSGGPLVNKKGEVIGVNSQIAFADLPDGSQILQQQINFALEADICVRLVNDIIRTSGRVVRAYLGIELVQSYGYMDLGYEDYVYYAIDELPKLNDVLRGSPAFTKLSPKIGSNITAINDVSVSNLEEALGELESVKPGDKVKFTFQDDGYNTSTAVITAGELTTDKLDVLAKHVMDKNTDVSMDYSHPQVAFTMGNNDMYYQEEPQQKQQQQKQPQQKQPQQKENQNDGQPRQDQKKYKQNHRGGYDAEKYFILAAGVHSDSYPNMWITEDYQDLGAALRLSGLAGSIDYYIMVQGGTEDDIEVVRQYLSGSEEDIQTTLWY